MKKFIALCVVISIFFNNIQAQNYNEAEVPEYSLPEILTMPDGKPITSKADWEEKRKPEILSLFEQNVYGQMPENYDSLTYKTVNENKSAIDGRAHLKEVVITIWRKNKSVDIQLTLFIPNDVKKPAPAFLLINNRGKENTDPSRTNKSEFWPAELVIDSGYAIAAFHVDDAAPDKKDEYQNGVLQLYPEQLEANDGMKAIGAWAWAARRIMDYFQTDKEIDAGNIALVGHSRGGKASLWAGANDPRFKIVISNCSGNTGAALSRRIYGETVKDINENFPHWFAENYKKFNDNENALPVDQHMLLALIAPRPLYVTNATEDLWADPKGTYLSLRLAEKTYDLYNMKSRLTEEPPRVNTAITHSILGYHNREGAHNMTQFDWKNFIKFANYHLK